MVKLVRGVTVCSQSLGWFQWMVGSVYEPALAKTHEQTELCNSICRDALFCAAKWCFDVSGGIEDGWLVFQLSYDVWNVFNKFAQACVDRNSMLCFKNASFFSLKQSLSSFNIGYYRPLKHAAQITLDQWNWFLTLCLEDMLWYFFDLLLT